MALLRPTWETAWALVLGMKSEHLAENPEGFDEDTVERQYENFAQACREEISATGDNDEDELARALVFNLGAVQGAFIYQACAIMHELIPSLSAHEHFVTLLDMTRQTLERADAEDDEDDSDPAD